MAWCDYAVIGAGAPVSTAKKTCFDGGVADRLVRVSIEFAGQFFEAPRLFGDGQKDIVLTRDDEEALILGRLLN